MVRFIYFILIYNFFFFAWTFSETKAWSTWWEKIGGTSSMLSLFKLTNHTFLMTVWSKSDFFPNFYLLEIWVAMTLLDLEVTQEYQPVCMWSVIVNIDVLCNLTNCFVFCFCFFSLISVRPFRRLDSNGVLQWDRIKSLEKGQIYKQVRYC